MAEVPEHLLRRAKERREALAGAGKPPEEAAAAPDIARIQSADHTTHMARCYACVGIDKNENIAGRGPRSSIA